MKTFLRAFLKPFSFLPAIFMMIIIYSFSGQSGAESAGLSLKVSVFLVELASDLFEKSLSPEQIYAYAQTIHWIVRKLAHMGIYFLLAVSVSFPLYVYGLRGIRLMLTAGIFCVAFACSDEYHQSLVEGRGPSKRDVFIDSIGIFAGVIIVRIVGFIGRMTIFRPLSKKRKGAKGEHT